METIQTAVVVATADAVVAHQEYLANKEVSYKKTAESCFLFFLIEVINSHISF